MKNILKFHNFSKICVVECRNPGDRNGRNMKFGVFLAEIEANRSDSAIKTIFQVKK